MKKYAKIGQIRFSQTKNLKGEVDLTVSVDVQRYDGTVEVVRCDTNILPSDDLTTIIRVITDQVDIAIREAREL